MPATGACKEANFDPKYQKTSHRSMASDSHSHSLPVLCADALAHGARAIAGSPAALALQSRRTAPFGTIQRERRRGPQCPNASPPGVAPDLTVCKCKECTERADVWTEIISERPEGATHEAWELLEALNNEFGAVDAVSQLTELERRCDYSRLGVPVRCGGLGPRFSRSDGSLNMENESARRRIPLETLQNFEAARNGGRRFGPYRLEYRTGRYEKFEGVFEGDGETRGDWDMFTHFTADKDASKGVRDLACGHVVELGSAGRTAALVRILRGTKPAGTAAAGRRQYFYIALLWDDEWLYATIPNISNTFKRLVEDDEDGGLLWEDKPEWTAIESRLENFEPKSFSAAIKAAGAFTKKRNQSHQAASSTQPSASPSPQTSPGGTEQSDEHMSDGESSESSDEESSEEISKEWDQEDSGETGEASSDLSGQESQGSA